MTKEEVELAKRTTMSETVLSAPATGVLAIPYSETRVALLITNRHTTQTLVVGYGADIAFTGGIFLASGGGSILLNANDHGAMVRGPFVARGNAGTGTIAFWETHLNTL